MSDAESSQLQVDCRIVWAQPQRSLAIINRLRDPPVVGENGGAEPERERRRAIQCKRMIDGDHCSLVIVLD